jgi:alanyl-tRNA synthetase
MVTKDLAGRFHAGNIIGQLAPIVGGKGGGRPDMAQAGGNQPENIDKLLAELALIVVK